MSSNSFLDIALQASQAGEQVIRHYYDVNVKVTMNEDYTPVPVAAVETEQKIKEVILGAFPDHGFYGEETGKTNADVNEAARKVVVDSGFKGHDYLGLLGHSIGLTGLTYPIIGEIAAVGSEDIVELKPGMIFSMEPGIFIPGTPGGGGVRLEDTILITEDGNEVFTKTPYDENLLS